jgi:hypothetical protein
MENPEIQISNRPGGHGNGILDLRRGRFVEFTVESGFS